MIDPFSFVIGIGFGAGGMIIVISILSWLWSKQKIESVIKELNDKYEK